MFWAYAQNTFCLLGQKPFPSSGTKILSGFEHVDNMKWTGFTKSQQCQYCSLIIQSTHKHWMDILYTEVSKIYYPSNAKILWSSHNLGSLTYFYLVGLYLGGGQVLLSSCLSRSQDLVQLGGFPQARGWRAEGEPELESSDTNSNLLASAPAVLQSLISALHYIF